MSNIAVILPILIPLLAGALLLFAGNCCRRLERAVAVLATTLLLPLALWLVTAAASKS